MARQLFTNNAISLLSAPINSTATSLTVLSGDGALFPLITTAGDYFLITLEDQAATVREIIKVTNRVGDVLYFNLADRGKENTDPLAWTASTGYDTVVDLRITAATLDRINDGSGGGTGTALVTYAESTNSSTFAAPAALADNSVAIGNGALTENDGVDSLALGEQAWSRLKGGIVHASGRHTTQGDCQTGEYIARIRTATSAYTELYLDGEIRTQRIVLPDNCTWMFDIHVMAHCTNAVGYAAFRAKGIITRDNGVSSIQIRGSINYEVITQSNTAWGINIEADTTNGSLKISSRGEVGKSIRWAALVKTVEETN